MKKVTFKCEIITPMFLGGADGRTPELRPPTIKGALRFWWRALHGNLELKDLKKQETEIFGGSGEGDSGKKSSFKILVNENLCVRGFSNLPSRSIQVEYPSKTVNVDIIKYLGLGMFQSGKIKKGNFQEEHSCFPQNQIFEMNIIVFKEMYKQDVFNALKAMELFGNWGAKSRNGFGGFKINESSDSTYPIGLSVEEFMKENNVKNDLPKYTAFSSKIKILKSTPMNKWDDALFEIGKAYLLSRKEIDRLHTFDNRKYIAFPVNTVGDEVYHFIKKEDRHSKPFFFKVLKENNLYVPYIFYFPSEYVFGIENLDKYKNAQIDQAQETENFLSSCNLLLTSLNNQGFKEVTYV